MQREIGSTFTYNGKEYKVCNSIDWCDGCDFYETDCSSIKLLGNCTNRIFKEMKKFTKSDLKPGMVVEYKNGNRRLVVRINNDLHFMSSEEFLENVEKEYDDNLTCAGHESLNIMKIYSVNTIRELNTLLSETYYLDLIWERKEPKEYTMQEIADKLGISVEELRIKK